MNAFVKLRAPDLKPFARGETYTFDQMKEVILNNPPGSVFARRKTWEPGYWVEKDDAGVLRLHWARYPIFGPEWKKSGYDSGANDYELYS